MYALSYLINNSFCLPLTLQYGFFFYISSDGRYIKGPAYVLMALMSYGYLLVIGVKALAGMFRKSNFARRRAYSAVASFVVCPLIAGLIQSFHTGLSILCMGCTVALVQVFINIQQSRITIDPLTQINNRSRLLQHLDKALARQKGSPEHTSIPALIQAADKALYQAKAAGKQSRANLH